MDSLSKRGAVWLREFWPEDAGRDCHPWLLFLAERACTNLPLARQVAILHALKEAHEPLNQEALIEAVVFRLGPCFGTDPSQTLRLDIRQLRRAGACIRYTRTKPAGYVLVQPPGRPTPEEMNRRLGSVDLQQLELLGQLSPAKRVRAMLEARAMVVAGIRGRLGRDHPQLTSQELSVKILEELGRYG